jgi:hypothetical protein
MSSKMSYSMSYRKDVSQTCLLDAITHSKIPMLRPVIICLVNHWGFLKEGACLWK